MFIFIYFFSTLDRIKKLNRINKINIYFFLNILIFIIGNKYFINNIMDNFLLLKKK